MRSWLLVLAACGRHALAPEPPDSAPTPDAAADAAPDPTPLEVHALGVQGFVLARGHDVVMTAPLFTRQSAFDVTFNAPITPDTNAIDAHLAGEPLADLRAVISGHAHYDHFLDVAHILALAPNAAAYTNLTGRHVLAALAPDRDASCTSAAAAPALDRARVIAMDDPDASYVDYTNCPDQAPPGAPLQGAWLNVPGANVRMMAFCSMHPAQVAGIYHFGIGSIDRDQCDVPTAASGWLEGQTLAFVIDFLDEAGAPKYRVYYQDAPTNAPLGYVPPAILAEHPVDVAILCVGSYDAVQNQPTDTIANIQPRFVLEGHWEDFFQPVDSPPQPIPLLDVQTYDQRVEAALPGRHALVQPGSHFTFPM